MRAMPVQLCLGVECGPSAPYERSAWERSVSQAGPSPRQERKSTTEAKSHNQLREGINNVLNTLGQQQLTLHSIVELQRDLQGLVLRQHQDLERQIAEYSAVSHFTMPDPVPVATEPASAPMQLAPSLTKGKFATDNAEDEFPTTLMNIHGHHRAESSLGECLSHGKSDASHAKAKNSHENKKKKGNGFGRNATTIRGFLGDTRNLKKIQKQNGLSQTKSIRSWNLGHMVRSPLFEAFFAFVTVLNFMAIIIELEWKGYHSADVLNNGGSLKSWRVAEDVFRSAAQLFNFLFLVELILRLRVFKCKWLYDSLNMMHATIVVATCLDSFVADIFIPENAYRVRILTVLRVLRLFLFLRVMRYMRMVAALRVLIKTLSMSLDSLMWSMLVVGFIIVLSAMVMVQLTAPFITDTAGSDSSLRRWLFKHYGSTGRASYTMFEATFSAKWATHLARPLIEDVSPLFTIFWVCYTVAVNFAVIRVIAALFLKQTMAVAAIDAERLAFERIRQKEKTVQTLRAVFVAGDTSGDGELDREEFEDMMENQEVLAMFEDLELEPHELHMLFELLSQDDGVVDQEEFLLGAMKLKNTARTVDMIQVLHQQTVMKRYIEHLREGIERIDSALHPIDPWKAVGRRASDRHTVSHNTTHRE